MFFGHVMKRRSWALVATSILAVVVEVESGWINLYDALLARGVSVTEPRAVKLVMVVQQFLPPCQPTVEEQSQVLQVDYIRFVEGP